MSVTARKGDTPVTLDAVRVKGLFALPAIYDIRDTRTTLLLTNFTNEHRFLQTGTYVSTVEHADLPINVKDLPLSNSTPQEPQSIPAVAATA